MNTEFARQQMIAQQVRAWDVLDKTVLEVIGSVPREAFVPAGYESLAFADTEIPIGHGEAMLTPTVEGRVLQALDLAADDAVLEIGCGSGFLTACLARLAAEVTSIDIHADFVSAARDRLAAHGIDNIALACLDASRELPTGAFDAIAVGASIAELDTRFIDALKPGGRLFVVVGQAPAMRAERHRKSNDGDAIESETLFETVLAPLRGGSLPPRFVF